MKEKKGKDYDAIPPGFRKNQCCRKTGQCSEWLSNNYESTDDIDVDQAKHNDHDEWDERIETNWWIDGLNDCCRRTGKCNQYFP